jgi:hypothetical protein
MAYGATKSSRGSADDFFKENSKVKISGMTLQKLLQIKIFLWLKILIGG